MSDDIRMRKGSRTASGPTTNVLSTIFDENSELNWNARGLLIYAAASGKKRFQVQALIDAGPDPAEEVIVMIDELIDAGYFQRTTNVDKPLGLMDEVTLHNPHNDLPLSFPAD